MLLTQFITDNASSLITWFRQQLFARFLHCEITIFFVLSILLSSPYLRDASKEEWGKVSTNFQNNSVRFILSPHLFIQPYLYQHDLMYIYNQLWVIIKYQVILLLKLFQLRTLGALSGWLLCSFNTNGPIILFFRALPYFLTLLDALGSSCIFLPQP